MVEHTDVAHCTAVVGHTPGLSDEWSDRCKTGETCQTDTDSHGVLQAISNVDI